MTAVFYTLQHLPHDHHSRQWESLKGIRQKPLVQEVCEGWRRATLPLWLNIDSLKGDYFYSKQYQSPLSLSWVLRSVWTSSIECVTVWFQYSIPDEVTLIPQRITSDRFKSIIVLSILVSFPTASDQRRFRSSSSWN